MISADRVLAGRSFKPCYPELDKHIDTIRTCIHEMRLMGALIGNSYEFTD